MGSDSIGEEHFNPDKKESNEINIFLIDIDTAVNLSIVNPTSSSEMPYLANLFNIDDVLDIDEIFSEKQSNYQAILVDPFFLDYRRSGTHQLVKNFITKQISEFPVILYSLSIEQQLNEKPFSYEKNVHYGAYINKVYSSPNLQELLGEIIAKHKK